MTWRKLFLLFAIFCIARAASGQAPIISAFSPLNGPPGISVVVSGTNFSAVSSQNIVYFGQVRGIVRSSSINSLVVMVPLSASCSPISVTVINATAYSSLAFIPTQTLPQTLSGASYAAHNDFATATSPGYVSLADFDTDGFSDVAATTSATTSYNFAALRNQSDCKNLAIGAAQNFFTNNAQPEGGVAAADLDGDGRIDAAISEPNNNRVNIFQNLSNSGTINFANGIALASTTLPTRDIKITDLDGDGKPDIVVSLFNALLPTSGVAIYRNTSSGTGSFTFATPQVISFVTNPAAVEISDLDGDGKFDLVVSDGISSVRVRRNKSTTGALDNTSFENEVLVATATGPGNIRAGDIDGDGKNDLAIACTSNVSVLRFNGVAGVISAASFDTHVDFAGAATSLDLGDLNGDAKIDIAVSNASNISVMQNKASSGSISTTSFAPRVDFSIGTASVNQISIGDMNGDGFPDLVGTQTGNFVSVFIYQPPAKPSPVITSFSPASGLVNTSVTITGTNFGVNNTANAVYFGTIKGTITSSSATQLVVTVPAYAAYAPITVENLTNNLSTVSRTNFLPTFDNNKDFGGRIIPAAFAKAINLNAGASNSAWVNVGDLDGDGFPDLISSSSGSDSVIIFRNKGTNTLTSAGFQRTGLRFVNDGNHLVLATDVDGDGRLDVVVMTRGVGDNDEVLIYRNESSPGSLTPASFGPAFEVHLGFLHINNGDVAVGDIDGDGRPELVCANSGAISVFKNNSLSGSFCFAPAVNIPSIGGAGISLGDIDGDGKLDIATTGGFYGYGGFYLVRNKSVVGALLFDTPVAFASTGLGSFNNVEIADLDNDNKPDVCWVGVLSSGSQGMQVMRNTAVPGSITTSSLAANVEYAWNGFLTNSATRCKVADMNGDKKPDVIVGNGAIGIFQNVSATGTIDASSFLDGVSYEIPVNYSAQSPVASDLDGDGKPEVITTVFSYISNVIAIFHNETYPAPRVDQLKNSSSVTQSGGVGSTLSTQGDYQFTNNQSPTVRFGGEVAVVTTSTNTSVVTKVPQGATHERVGVTLHGLTGFSALPFSITFSTSAALDVNTFSSRVDFPLVTSATPGVSVGDLDNDGKPDVVVTDGGSVDIFHSVLASHGTDIASSMLVAMPQFGNGIGTLPVTIGDFDGDGLLDLHANSSVWRNNSGTQPTPISFEAGVAGVPGVFPQGHSKTNIDFNHDGKTDLLSTASANSVLVSENLTRKGAFGTGTFSSFGQAVTLTTSGNPGEATAADFDGDGYDDIVYLNKTNGQFVIRKNLGRDRGLSASSFGAEVPSPTLATPTYISSGDYDGDGKIDVAVAYGAAATLSIFQNTGGFNFSRIDVAAPANAMGIASADLNGDGRPEVVMINSAGTTYSFSIFNNTGSGVITFDPFIQNTLPTSPAGLSLADMNLDGKTDILITRSPATLSIFQNNLLAGSTITIDTQPSAQTVCKGATAVFSVTASGASNLQYQWQAASAAAGPFTDIANENPYSNVTTSTLSTATTDGTAMAYYRCRVNGDDAAEIITDAVLLAVNDCPGSPPVIATESLTTAPGGTIVIDLVPLITTTGKLDVSSIKVITAPGSGAVVSIDQGVMTISYAGDAFIGKESVVITACDDAGQCAQQEFQITISDDIIVYNGLSPNGDGLNDTFVIGNIDVLPNTKSNVVKIYSRWGDEVFSVTDYNNTTHVFNGMSNSGGALPTGTYYYKIILPDAGKTVTGYLLLQK